MANQLKMAEVQAILALARGGWSNRHIARQLGVHRETVGRHLRLSAADHSKPASAPLGSAGAPIGSSSTAGPWREVIVQKLEAGLTAQRIYQDLCGDQGYTGSYYSVRRLIKKLAATMPAPFRRMECEAAEARWILAGARPSSRGMGSEKHLGLSDRPVPQPTDQLAGAAVEVQRMECATERVMVGNLLHADLATPVPTIAESAL